MNLAADVSDHVVFLHQGLIEEEGPPRTLFNSPESTRLQQFLSAGGQWQEAPATQGKRAAR
jgi:polar amino acid transport system ATP-binding protein